MAYLPQDVHEFDVSQFQGSAQSVDPYTLDPAHGLYTQNTDFILGTENNGSGGIPVEASTRRGSSQVSGMPFGTGAVLSLFSWYLNLGGTQDCYVVYFTQAQGARFYSQVYNDFTTIVANTSLTGTIAAMSFATDGIRCYLAFMDATGRYSVNSGWIYNASAANVDKLFAPPFSSGTISFSVATASGGNATQGTHSFGIIYTTRNGYTGPLSPVAAGGLPFVFLAWGMTLASPNLRVTITITFTSIPSYLNGGTIQLAMSPASNQAAFYAVPGTITPISSGTLIYNLVFNISDGALTATATDVTQYQNLLASATSDSSSPAANTPPFYPSAVFTFSSRMAYVTLDQSGFPVVYFSDPSNYQSLTAAYHGIYLEGKQIPVHGCSVDQVCYIATLSGLYQCADNGGYPATWTPPARVDGSVGILAPSCLLSRGGRILVASEKGLFSYRGGTFPQIPLSYWQSNDWNRINWAAPAQVSVQDDAFDRVIRVLAPLKVLVTAATNSSGTVTITTGIQVGANVLPYPHLFQPGISVTISGVSGSTGANGTQTVLTVPTPNTFTISAAGSGIGSGGLAVPNSPNAELTWNYTLGETPQTVMYSLNAFGLYRQGASAVIRNIATGYDEIWYAPAAAGGLIRRVLPLSSGIDANVYQDVDLSNNPAPIAQLYETGLVPGPQDQASTLHDFHGMHVRMSGAAVVNVTVNSLDHGYTLTPRLPLSISGVPAREYLVKWWMRNEQQTITFGVNTAGYWFVLALLRVYWTNSLVTR
jgi:hypothetical protein